jgi:IPT/TIG domain
MRTTPLTRHRTLGAVVALTLAAAAAGAVVAPVANAASVAATLSAASGPSAGGNTITATTATAKFVTGAVYTQFQVKATSTSACAANFQATATVTATAGVINVTAPKILSATKLAVTVPSGVALPSGSTALSWNLCVYNGNTTGSTSTTANIVIVNAAYSIAASPTLTAISPAGGPALGGGTVTVTGTNFVTGMTASVGGTALTAITVASGGTSFTATVPPRAAGAANLSVTTPGGTKNKTAGNAYVPYTYSNGIVVSPSTAPTATAATDLDIMGVGFSSLDFSTTTGTTPDNDKAHVYIVQGSYDSTDASSAKTVTETGECVNVLVISDTELICTLNTADSFNQSGDPAVDDGTYTITVVSNGEIDIVSGGANEDLTATQSVVSSGSTFTVAAY